jgi:hypothetical protein
MSRVFFLILALGVTVGACGGSMSGGGACLADGECPLHQGCEGGACVTGCITDSECGEGRSCSAHGRCSDFHDASASNQPDLATVPDLTASLDLAEVPDLAPACGDGHVDSGEDCDDGASNSDDPGAAASCTSQCRKRAFCGALASNDGARIDPASGHCYVAWAGPANWATAQQRCHAEGGALASAGSAAEEALLQSLAGSRARWTALRASNADGDCSRVDQNGFLDSACGWPGSGLLPSPSPLPLLGWICESGCGNGVVEPGESCDPPSLAAGSSCTATCQTIQPCSEGMTSPVSGHCYFVAGPNGDYATALSACPAGTHLATLETPDETELARKVVTTDTWIALRAATTVGAFVWDKSASEPFVAARYHGFVDGEPNHNSSPTCTRLLTTGWKDQVCNSSYPHLCERE